MPPFGVRFKPEAVGKRNKAGWKIRLQRPWWASYASGFRVLETGVGLVGCLKMWFCQQTHFTQSAQWGNPRQCYVAVDSLYHYLSSFSMGTFCEIAQGSHVAFLSMKWSEGNDATSSHFAVLPNHVPGPAVFCAVFQLLGGSHICCVVVACFSETVSNWTVIQFSNPELLDDTLESKRRITIWSGPSQKMSCVGVQIVILQI